MRLSSLAILGAVALLLVAAGQAQASIIAADNFNSGYTTGAVVGQSSGDPNWQPWVISSGAGNSLMQIVSGSLNYNAGGFNIGGSSGQSLLVNSSTNSTTFIYEPLTTKYTYNSSTAADLYYSCLIKVIGGTTGNGMVSCDANGVGNGANSYYGNTDVGSIVLQGASAQNHMGCLAAPSTGSAASGFDGSIALNATYFVVAHIWHDNASTTSSFNRIDLYIDPTTTTDFTPGAAQYNATSSGTQAAGQNAQFLHLDGFGVAGKSSTSGIQVDNFTFGTTLADVIPEPATMSLLGLGLGVLAIRRKRRSA